MNKDYKNDLFQLILDNTLKFHWEQDRNSGYTDYEAKLGDSIKIRVVSNREGEYLQILMSPTSYRVYEAKDYPRVADILKTISDDMKRKKDDEFFETAYKKIQYNLCKV